MAAVARSGGRERTWEAIRRQYTGSPDPRFKQPTHLVDNVQLEVEDRDRSTSIDVPTGLLDLNRLVVLSLGLVEDDGNSGVTGEHHVVVQRSSDGVVGVLGEGVERKGSIEDVVAARRGQHPISFRGGFQQHRDPEPTLT